MDKVSPVFLRLLWPAEALAPLFLFMALTTVAATMSPSPAPSPAPTPTPTPTPATLVITEAEFNELLPYHDSKDCPANGFYTYSAFIAATKAFPNFGTVGDLETRRREMAAFFAQVAQETYSGCYIRETGGGWYCTWSIWPCLLGRKYFGRGPLQLRWNYNYGYAGLALRAFLLMKPDLVSSNASLSFETAIWLWMTQHSWKIPSCHDAILGKWKPTSADEAAGRRPGFGVTTNILLSVNGKEQECGRGKNQAQESRISHYENYCLKLGVSAGDNVDCSNQTQFSNPSALQLHSTHAAVL